MGCKKVFSLANWIFFISTSFFLVIHCEDPYLYYTWNVTYGILSPLGVPQQVILINGQFPGPRINGTSNNNVVVNVFNRLDEPLLFTWNGIEQRKNSWEEGKLGTNCPIQPGTNWTYYFQVKDQIGSYYYYPSTSLHRAAGGYGPLTVMSRALIPVPFDTPEEDYTILVGDWYAKNHTTLRKYLDSGRSLARPDNVIINGKHVDPKGKSDAEPMFFMAPGKKYRYRICNVGMKNSLNVRFQEHYMKLIEIEGSHTLQNLYESLDIHLGQCLSVLVHADQEPKDYYFVASTRFTKQVLTSIATIRYNYSNGKPASPDIPPGPDGWPWSLNQFRTFRWNLTASAARPNPQGSYHYGQINITRTIKLVNSAAYLGGKLRYAINGVSHLNPSTPLKLAEYFGVGEKLFRYDIIGDEPPEGGIGSKGAKVILAPNVVRAIHRNFVEIVFENPEKSVQSYHLSGYAFFAVAVEPGKWTPEKRKNYNLEDAVSRNTIQVYPKSWAAIMTSFDNAGMWSLRSMLLERQYLGQELYLSVPNPGRSLRNEYNIPDNDILCGIVKGMPKPEPYQI